MLEDAEPRSNNARLDSLLQKPLIRLIIYLGVISLAVALFVCLGFGLRWYLSPTNELSITERKDLVQGIASIGQAIAVGLTGAAAFVSLLFTSRSLRQTREQIRRTLELTEQGQITERFTRAIDQLGTTDDKGKPQLEIRLGGIYALERIDKESSGRFYHGTVMEVLTAYVRENAPWRPNPDPSAERPARGLLGRLVRHRESIRSLQDKAAEPEAEAPPRRAPRVDIQAILDVLKRREEDEVPERHRVRLDLRGADLRGADLNKTDLKNAHLQGAHLGGAILIGARLEAATLWNAHLEGAFLQGAHLQRADFRDADCRNAFSTRPIWRRQISGTPT